MQRHVGIHDSDQGHIRKMQAFGDHLRAQEHIDFSDPEIAEDAFEIVFALERIGIHPPNAGVREKLGQRLFNTLCSQTGKTDLRGSRNPGSGIPWAPYPRTRRYGSRSFAPADGM